MTSLAAPKAGIIEGREILLHGPARLLAIKFFVPLRSRDRALLVGVGRNQAGIHRKTFAADQAGRNARANDTLEHAPKDGAVAKPLIARTRERRMIWDLVLDREPAKPAIGKVHLHLTTQRPLRADCKHIADDEHPDHQHRINRGPTNLRVIARQLGINPRQIKNCRNRANQVIVRHRIIKAK